jgi:hypothetical protein
MRWIFPVGMSLFCLFCAASRTRLSVQTPVVDSRFSAAGLSNRKILLLPPLCGTAALYRTDSLLRPILSQWFARNRPDISLCFSSLYEQHYLEVHDTQSLRDFYTNLALGALLKAQTSDSLFKATDADFLFVIRMQNPARIKTMNGTIKRRSNLECELWSTAMQAPLWKSGASIADYNGSQSDSHLLGGALTTILQQLPAFMPSLNESNW